MIACACTGCGERFEAAPEGGHRVMCGDSTSADDVGRLMDGARADLCFTSPPYAQQREYVGGVGDWDSLMQGVFAVLPLTHEAQVLVNLGLVHRDNEWQPYWDGWIAWMRGQGWRRFGWYVWDQGPGLPGNWNGRLAPSHEFIFHFNRAAAQARKTKRKLDANVRMRTGRVLRAADGSIAEASSPRAGLQLHKVPDSVVRVMRTLDAFAMAVAALSDDEVAHWPDSVVRVMRQKGAVAKGLRHPAPFPVALPTEMLLAYSDAGDVLYEPFCGAGSAVIAAEMHARRCYGMEIAPQYCDVVVQRWQMFTGSVAVRADGVVFGQALEAVSVAA